MKGNSSGRITADRLGRATLRPGKIREMPMSVSVEAVAAGGSDEAREAARAERAFLLVLAAVIALEAWGLAWFFG